jgi:peptidoglycan/LPS O-acetylase OafA/YrhL
LKRISNKYTFPSKAYYPALAGLRGIAILMVICYHSFNFIYLFKIGWTGVDLFFVLSGFLITDILLTTKEETNFLRNFYMRRILRIFPIYYISLIICFFILPKLRISNDDLNYFLNYQKWFWFYLQNWLFVFKDPLRNDFLSHFWTLALEEQFYLVWPWIILIINKPQKLITILLSILLGLFFIRLLLWSIHIKNVSYENLFFFTRADGLCIGCIIACLQHSEFPSSKESYKVLLLAITISFVCMTFAKFFWQHNLPYMATCIYTSIAIFFGIIVYMCLNKNNFLYSFFNIRVLKFFGKISYSLYIIHWPVHKLLTKSLNSAVNEHLILPSFISAILTQGILILISIVLSVISYYCIEIHFLKLKRFF